MCFTIQLGSSGNVQIAACWRQVANGYHHWIIGKRKDVTLRTAADRNEYIKHRNDVITEQVLLLQSRSMCRGTGIVRRNISIRPIRPTMVIMQEAGTLFICKGIFGNWYRSDKYFHSIRTMIVITQEGNILFIRKSIFRNWYRSDKYFHSTDKSDDGDYVRCRLIIYIREYFLYETKRMSR